MKPRSRKPLGMLAATLLLPACATVSAPDYPRQHPANPDAIQTPVPAASSALDTYRLPSARNEPSGQPAEPASRDGHGKSAQERADEPRKDEHDHH